MKKKPAQKIEYTSPNGYRGVLYGKSSMSIYGPNGREVIHTGHRTPNTLEELTKQVDSMPEFMEMLTAMQESHKEKEENS